MGAAKRKRKAQNLKRRRRRYDVLRRKMLGRDAAPMPAGVFEIANRVLTHLANHKKGTV